MFDEIICSAWKNKTQFIWIVLDDLAASGEGIAGFDSGSTAVRSTQPWVMWRLVEINWIRPLSGSNVSTRQLVGAASTTIPFGPRAKIFLVPKIEDMNGLIVRQSEFLPVQPDLFRLVRVKIENAHDIVIAAQMIDFQIPDPLVPLAREKDRADGCPSPDKRAATVQRGRRDKSISRSLDISAWPVSPSSVAHTRA